MFENRGDAIDQNAHTTFVWMKTVRLIELRIQRDT
jgi:hypothetical protein